MAWRYPMGPRCWCPPHARASAAALVAIHCAADTPHRPELRALALSTVPSEASPHFRKCPKLLRIFIVPLICKPLKSLGFVEMRGWFRPTPPRSAPTLSFAKAVCTTRLCPTCPKPCYALSSSASPNSSASSRFSAKSSVSYEGIPQVVHPPTCPSYKGSWCSPGLKENQLCTGVMGVDLLAIVLHVLSFQALRIERNQHLMRFQPCIVYISRLRFYEPDREAQ